MSSAFTLIEDAVLGSAAASITFSTGLTDYTKFRLTLYVIKDGSSAPVYMRLNGDTGTNYARQTLDANSTAVTGARATGATEYRPINTQLFASNPAILTAEIAKPLTTTPARITSSLASINTAGNIILWTGAGEWSNTADLISSISILASAGDFAANTRAVLEGAA